MSTEHETQHNQQGEPMTPHVDKDLEHTAQADAASPARSWQLFLYVIAGGLIISALISVIAILFGGIGGIISKSLLTTFSVMAHSLVALGLLHTTSPTQKPQFLVQVVFGITIGSLLASGLSIWEVVDGSMTTNFYQLFFFMLVCAAIAEVILFATKQDKLTRYTQYTALGFDAALLLILLPWIFFDSTVQLPDIYYRGIAAISILLGTSALLTAIAHILYRSKNPKPQPTEKQKTSTATIVFWVLFGLFTIYVAPFLLIGFLS